MYDHTSRTDMANLARELRTAASLRHPQFYAAILATGIMRTRLSMHVGAWIIRKSRRLSRTQAWYVMLVELQKRSPGLLDDAIEQLAKHVESGKDRVDPMSAGGLNGPEVAKLIGLMQVCGWHYPSSRAAFSASFSGT